MKRVRVQQTPWPDAEQQRSPSPTLPVHLYTSLPSASCSSSSAAIDAREATLLDPRDCNDTPDALEPVTWTGWIDDDSQQQQQQQQQRREVITDRYDILHLVPSIPSPTPPPHGDDSALPSVGFGFEDLPSDHEELFFLNSTADRANLDRRKKRRRLQDERDHRVGERLLQQQRDGCDHAGDGGSHNDDDEEEDDKEPPAEINQLMSRLHTTLSRSANPALLELRILANHGSDSRFASFLKREGRWYRWWVDLREGKGKAGAGAGAVAAKEEVEATGGLGGLAAYGSDSDDDDAALSSEDGQEAQGRSEAKVKDDAEQQAASPSSASTSPPRPAVFVPECASTGPSTTTTSTVASAPPPTDPSAPKQGDFLDEPTTVAHGVQEAAAEGENQHGDVAKRQEEEEKEKKKEARAAKAREWARKRRDARREEEEEKDAVELA